MGVSRMNERMVRMTPTFGTALQIELERGQTDPFGIEDSH